MSASALQALTLHHALADGGLDALAMRFFERTADVVEDAWNVSVGTDILSRYLSRMTRKAHRDGRLADAYTRVVTMQEPPTSLLRPRIAWRVLKPEVTS